MKIVVTIEHSDDVDIQEYIKHLKNVSLSFDDLLDYYDIMYSEAAKEFHPSGGINIKTSVSIT